MSDDISVFKSFDAYRTSFTVSQIKVNMALRRIRKELKDFQSDPLANWTAAPEVDNMYHWKGVMTGAKDTPYANGKFIFHINFPQDYPFKPPKLKLITPIYHMNFNQMDIQHI